MSKKELNRLKQRIQEVAINIKEQEAITTQIHHHFRKMHPQEWALSERASLRKFRV